MEEKESILIVDDDKSTRDILSLTFQRKGYETVTVASGAEAKEKLGERFFNVALVDIRLPDMQGTDLLGPFNEMHPEMAVVLITGFSSLETALQALEEGAAAYIAKPLGMDDIIPRIEELLEKQRLVREKRKAEEDSTRYRERLEALHKHVLNLGTVTNLEDIVEFTLDAMETTLGFKFISILNVEKDELKTTGLRGSESTGMTLPLDGKGITVKAVREARSIMVDDIREDPDFVQGSADSLSELAVPVKDNGEVYAVLNIESKEIGGFSEDDHRLMETLAAHVGSAISRLRQIDSYRTHAAVFDSVSDSLMIIDPDDHSIISANSIAQIQGGLTLAEIVGRPCYEVSHQRSSPCEPPDHICPLEKMIETGESSTEIHLHQDVDGNPRYEEISVSPIRNQDGEIVQFVHVARDITERIMMEEELKESEQRFRSLFDNTREAIVVTDSMGKIASVNSFGVSMLGYDDHEEILGRPAVDFYVDPSQRGALYTELMKDGFSTGRELMLKKKDGSEIWVSAFSTLHRDDDEKVLRTESFFRDVTERKLAELKLRDLVLRLNGISHGRCYLVDSHERSYKIYVDLMLHGSKGLCMTRDDPESLIAQYSLEKESILLVSSRPLRGFETVNDLQGVSRAIKEFITDKESPVIVLDGLEYLINRAGFDAVYTFLQEKRFDILDSRGVLLLPFDPLTLSERELALLKSEVEYVD